MSKKMPREVLRQGEQLHCYHPNKNCSSSPVLLHAGRVVPLTPTTKCQNEVGICRKVLEVYSDIVEYQKHSMLLDH